MSDLEIVVPPTSIMLLDPDEVRQRLKRPVEELASVTRSVEEVSRTIAGYLTFEPWYQEVLENFTTEDVGEGCGADRLPLAGRPFISVTSVGVPGQTALVQETDFSVRRTGRSAGDAYLFRPRGWAITWPGDLSYALVAQYRMGWWLPGMTGLQPADVKTLPEDIALAAWLTFQHRYLGDQLNPRIAEMDKGRVRLKMTDRDPTSVPDDADDILATYRPLILG